MMRPQGPRPTNRQWQTARSRSLISPGSRLEARGGVDSPNELYPPDRALLVPAELFPSRPSSVLGGRALSASRELGDRRKEPRHSSTKAGRSASTLSLRLVARLDTADRHHHVTE